VAREGHGRPNIALLHASYGQRTRSAKRRAFDDIANFYGVHERLPCNSITFARLADQRSPTRAFPFRKMNWVRPARWQRDSVTYVPFRNAHFLSVAVSWAEAIGAGAIYIGAVAEDSSGYPDCRPEYYRVFPGIDPVGTRPETQMKS